MSTRRPPNLESVQAAQIRSTIPIAPPIGRHMGHASRHAAASRRAPAGRPGPPSRSRAIRPGRPRIAAMNLWNDLRQRRLWPLALGLMLVIMAVPAFLARSPRRSTDRDVDRDRRSTRAPADRDRRPSGRRRTTRADASHRGLARSVRAGNSGARPTGSRRRGDTLSSEGVDRTARVIVNLGCEPHSSRHQELRSLETASSPAIDATISGAPHLNFRFEQGTAGSRAASINAADVMNLTRRALSSSTVPPQAPPSSRAAARPPSSRAAARPPAPHPNEHQPQRSWRFAGDDQ